MTRKYSIAICIDLDTENQTVEIEPDITRVVVNSPEELDELVRLLDEVRRIVWGKKKPAKIKAGKEA